MNPIITQKMKDQFLLLLVKWRSKPTIKKFEYNNQSIQQMEVICYSFSPSVLLASEKDLKEFLGVLSAYFPKTTTTKGQDKPMENKQLITTWSLAHTHISSLILRHQDRKRHYKILCVSVLTLLVLVVTLGHQVVHEKPIDVLLEQLCKAKKQVVANNNMT